MELSLQTLTICQVNFNAGSQSLPRGMDGRRGSRSQLSFSRRFPFVKSTDKLNEFTDNERKFITISSFTDLLFLTFLDMRLQKFLLLLTFIMKRGVIAVSL